MSNKNQQKEEQGKIEGQIRYCAYLRVSTSRQADSDLSIPDQRGQIAAFGARKGWSEVAEYVEPGNTATDDNRPEFQRLIDRASQHDRPFDVILVHSYNRFMRDGFLLELYIRRLAKFNVKLISITQELGEDPAQVMLRHVIGMFDEYQSAETSKHVTRSMQENARQGFHNGSTPPLGYKSVETEVRGIKVKKRLAIDTVEAETVRLIFRLYLHGDGTSGPLGVKMIVNYLNKAGYRTRRNAPFGRGGVHSLLTNRTFIGEFVFNKVCAKTGLHKDPSLHIVVSVPSIIDIAEFNEVQKTLKSKNPRVRAPREITGPILLTGIAVCAACGAGMTLRSGTSRAKKVHRYYSCSAAMRCGTEVCPGRSIPMQELDDMVVEHLKKQLFEVDRLAEMLSSFAANRSARNAEVDGRVAKLKKEVADANSKLDRLYKLVENGIATLDADLGSRIASIRLEREQSQNAFERIRVNNQAPPVISTDMIEKFGSIMRENISVGEAPFRKAYIRSVIERIEVDHKLVRIIVDKATLENAVMTKFSLGGEVHSSVPKWCTRLDSNQ
jgi:site-specific DNA recombinase